jgi:uncharacterized protein YggE
MFYRRYTDDNCTSDVSLLMLGVDNKDIQTVATNLSANFIEERVPKTLSILTISDLDLIAVRIRDIKRVKEIWSALIDQGVNRVNQVFFKVSNAESGSTPFARMRYRVFSPATMQ